MANFGVAHVDPSGGSNSNTGFSWSEAKQTIENAISAGFAQIETRAGVHTVSSITTTVTLVLHPGKHVFVNAPVVCTKPIGLMAANLTGGTGTTEATVTAASPVTDFFQFTDGTNILRGGYFGGIRFDAFKVTRSAIYATNLSEVVAENNYMVGTSWANVPMFYVTPTTGGEASHWRVGSNRPTYRPLVRVVNTNDRPMNGWVIRSNRCYGTAATDPLISVTGGQTRGWCLAGNLFDGVNGTAPAVYFAAATNQLYWYGNRGRNLTNTQNLLFRCDNVASAYIEQSLGDITSDGLIQVNGQLYSPSVPDTGTDGAGGRDIYVSATDVRVLMIGRY